MSIGARLRQWRGALGWSQDEASSKSGVPYSSYQKYEQDRAEPGAGSLQMLRTVGLNIDWLLSGEGQMLVTDAEKTASASAERASAVPADRGRLDEHTWVRPGTRNTDSPRLRMALALQLGRLMKGGGWCPSDMDIDTSDRIVSCSLTALQSAFSSAELEAVVSREAALEAALRMAFEAISAGVSTR